MEARGLRTLIWRLNFQLIFFPACCHLFQASLLIAIKQCLSQFGFRTWRPEAASHQTGTRGSGQKSKLLCKSLTEMSGSEKPNDRSQNPFFPLLGLSEATFRSWSLSQKSAKRSFLLLEFQHTPISGGSGRPGATCMLTRWSAEESGALFFRTEQ